MLNNAFERKTTFTLIEMLVVIAIIAILASFLMPTLSEAIETAKAIDCSNRMRQLFLVTQQYADDYNGLTPTRMYNTAASVPTALRGKCWQYLLWRYAMPGISAPRHYWPYDSAGYYQTVLNCPKKIDGVANHMLYGRTYALNCYLKKPGGSIVYQGQNIASAALYKVKTPSITLLFGEYNYYSSRWQWGGTFDNPLNYTSRILPNHHNGMTNATFIDGHVKRMLDDDWPHNASGDYASSYWGNIPFWSGG